MCRTEKTFRKKTTNGASYIIALTTLVVGVTLSLALLRLANANHLNQTNETMNQSAVCLADAGVDYALWNIYRNGAAVPFTSNLNLTTGSINVSVSDDSARETGALLITSTGTSKGISYTAKRVTGMRKKLPFDYALSQNNNYTSNYTIISAGTGPGVYVNGSATVNRSDISITNGLYASSWISVTSGTASPRYSYSAPVSFPIIDATYYSDRANQVYTSSVSFNNITSANSGINVVSGNLTLKGGNYTGTIVFVATGVVEIQGNYTPTNTSSYLCVLCPVKITVKAAATTVQAILYSSNSMKTAEINIDGSGTRIIGCVASDVFNVNSQIQVQRDTRITPGILMDMNLPGTY